MTQPKLAVVLGIRPDLIRASLVLRGLQARRPDDVVFIWSGQHYSDNLKDVFLRELDIEPPSIELGASGSTDAETVAAVISKLSPVLADLAPSAVVFLGDTNTVMGSLAAAQLNVPVVHIEGCMRSYDWRMPEEKYRTVIDHLADVIYTYFDEYKAQGVAEGLNPDNIVVVQNLIVDVLNHYYFDRPDHFQAMVDDGLLAKRNLTAGEYYLMTCHRRENVEERAPLSAIVELIGATDRPIYFPASYRTQKTLERFGLELPANVEMVDPIGYDEMLALMVNSRGLITDSGTVVEETAVLQVPSLQMRRATERPQVYDCGSSVKFDPSEPDAYPADVVFAKLESLVGKTWEHELGDGHAAERIVDDLLARLDGDNFRGHLTERHHLTAEVARSHQGDGLTVDG
jgi:UDP-N-acetylglucosamine 2-epimerase (non-hydrolysing)